MRVVPLVEPEQMWPTKPMALDGASLRDLRSQKRTSADDMAINVSYLLDYGAGLSYDFAIIRGLGAFYAAHTWSCLYAGIPPIKGLP